MASMVIHGGRHYPIFYYRKGAPTPILMGASERLVTLSTIYNRYGAAARCEDNLPVGLETFPRGVTSAAKRR